MTPHKKITEVGGSVGVVPTQYFTFAEGIDKFRLESGEEFGPITIAYETYGTLNPEKSNVVLIAHAFTGDAHAAGLRESDQTIGWWDFMIGPGKAFDTEKYFVLCANIIGGCKGSTGPSSLNPNTGTPYAVDFPLVTIKDMVGVQKVLLDHLGIKKLLTVTGGSMGGMQALQWIASYPDYIQSAIPIACTLKHSAQQIAFDQVGRVAVMSDPAWRAGHYYGHGQPERGLSLARMIGHITYMSDHSMDEKFSRRPFKADGASKFGLEFEVESYLHHRGTRFVNRFDANSYLYITKAMDYFDLSGEKLFINGLPKGAKFMMIAFTSDWLYPPNQAKDIVRLLKSKHLETVYCEIKSTYGHDAFLVEQGEQPHLIRHFLENLFRG